MPIANRQRATLAAIGFEHFPVGPGTPVLLVYGEAEYSAVCAGSSGLHHYTKVALPQAGEPGADDELRALFHKLTSRAVVIWPEAGADGAAHALRHAAMLADAGVTAVGIVETPDEFAPGDARARVDAALREALARAMPAQGANPARAIPPWPGEIDGAALFAAAHEFLARHLAEPATTLDAIVLWCLHVWALRSGARHPFEVSPRLVLQASDARADHARALRLIAWLTPAPLIVSRTIAAHLLPLIEAERPTLLLDDVAGSMLYRRDMRTLIAAGAHSDGLFLGARTRRNRSGRAACFAPAAIATAMALPDDMRMRAIVVPMAPPPTGDATRAPARLGEPDEDLLGLRAAMLAFAKAAAQDIAGDDDVVEALLPNTLSRAARENWAPLMAFARRISREVTARGVAAAAALSEFSRPPSSDLALLANIRECFGGDGRARISTAQMLAILTGDPELPWGRVHRGRPLDAYALAARLATFGLKPVPLRLAGGQIARGYRGEDLADAFARYLGDVAACNGDVTVCNGETRANAPM